MTFERRNIKNMAGYVPGEQPQQSDVLKLNTNENPYPASPQVQQSLSAIDVEQLRRYPSPMADQFRQLAAATFSTSAKKPLTAENIVPTNGGDELLRLAITTFVDSGDSIAYAEPGYSLYPVLAAIQDCQCHPIALTETWSLPENFADQLNRSGAKLAFLINPHAPTGLLCSVQRIAQIARSFSGVLVVDEAYVDFVDPELGYDLVALVNELDNLLILRTLSKGYSLAGIRFGYGIGSLGVTQAMLYKTRDSYNTDYVAQQIASASLQSIDYARITWDKIRQQRQRLYEELAGLGLISLPSQANFLLTTVPGPIGAKSLHQRLKQLGVLVRYFDQDRLRDKIRITVGSAQDNDRLLQCLKTLLG